MSESAVKTQQQRVNTRKILPPFVTGQEIVLIGVIVVLWVILGLTTPAFLAAGSVGPLLVQVAPIAIIGVGMTFVIITAGIDVSVGSIVMVAAVVTARSLVEFGLPFWPALLLSLLVGAALGALNGVLVAYGRVHAIIITFGTMNLFRFIGLQVFGSSTVNNMPPTFNFFGRGDAGSTLGIPHAFAIAVVITAIAWWYLRYTKGGRSLYAIGGNAHAARLAGIKVQPRILMVYALTGLLAGLAACMTLAAGTSTLDQSVGTGRELQVIAAVVIGGTSIIGGRGSVVGTLLGALLVQTVSSGVVQLGWPSQLAFFFVGLFIVIAVGTDLVRERARRRS
ncbi:ABC transporter permease [uncultured Agrococcus sp.]|uniref:ABC transporter permease n=1 Tax=uncultured Agrococcus sp. TaxID=382258 RepID=UPI0025DCCA3A|nr:ABC transporter permease [uncultured Agrococcus sp.]